MNKLDVLLVLIGLALLIALTSLCISVVARADGPEQFALIQKHEIHPQVLVMWKSPRGMMASVGLLYRSDADAITLYPSEDMISGQPEGEALVLRWDQVAAAWFMERGVPLEGDR